MPSARLARSEPGPPIVRLHFLSAPAVVVPSGVVPAKSVTVEPAGAVPMKVGVLSLVIPSEWEDPVSLAASSFGAGGPIVHWYEALWLFPAWSVAVRTKVWVPNSRPLRLTGLVAGVSGPPSRLYWTTRSLAVVMLSLVVKANEAVLASVCGGGVLVNWTTGLTGS